MDVQRWRQIDRIFQAALEREPAGRAAFLDEACSGDQRLRTEVEALLSSDGQGCDLLEGNAFEAAADLLAEDQPELAAGYRVGHYQVLGLIGAGGMGQVYLAEDTRLGRKVALKLLPASYTRSESRLRRFQQEARSASALNHPNILTIHDIWEIEGQHIIATEYIEGETLRQRLKQGKLGIEDTLDVSIQVASAIWAAHQAGIIHRDIKPENIMLRRDGYVKVLDFGLAKLTEHNERTPPHARVVDQLDVSSGLVMGTVRYMSPEQARGQQVDPRSDIFSFGIVLYEMLAGRAPFQGETSNELIAAILKKEPPPLTSLSDEMQRLVSRALHKKREERYQTIKDLLDDLKALREDKAVTGGGKLAAQSAPGSALSTTDATPISTASSIESIVSGIKRYKTSAAFVFASLVVVAVGLSFSLSRFTRLRSPSNQMRIARIPNMDKADEVAISPDGKYVAQVARNAGQYGIWLAELGAGNGDPVLILPAKTFLTGLTFSKDGGNLFYVSANTLYQVPVRGGGAAKVMADVDSPLSLAPDEKQVAFVRTRDSDQEKALTVANVDGSGERVLATRKKPEFIDKPAWSPDGKLIACSFGLVASNRTESLIGYEVATGQEKPITPRHWQGFVNLAWLPDTSGLVAAASETFGGPTQIWHISYPEGEVRRITNDLENYGNLSLTADGKNLAAFQFALRSSVWVMPRGNPGASPITSSERVVYRAVSFTPDGRILYPLIASGDQDIWIMNADGTNPKQLTENAGANILPKPSPDGRYIVFASNRANQNAFNIWRMDIDGGNPIQLTHGSGETGPACSLDGLWVVYSKGGPEVNNLQKTLWKVSIDGGEPVQVTNTPSNGAAISPDGTLIACWYKQATASPWQLALIPFTGGPPIKFFDAPRMPRLWPRWTPDGSAISYIDTREGVSNIWSQSISGGPPQQVTQFTSEDIAGFDWSRDGTLACSRFHSAQDVVLITDFR